ncbi:MAG: translation initiation factor [Bacteroidota bacterium]
MAKKKKNKRNFSGGMVYSTDPDYDFEEGYEEAETPPPTQQNLRLHLIRHKGNKISTVVRDFVGTDDDLKSLGKLLKSKCGTGGSAKDGEIIIQGNKRDKVAEILKKEGYKFKLVGG